MSDSVVIIPTYNEKENVENIVRKVFSLSKDFDVLIVDDSSPDGTGNIVRGLQEVFPNRLFLLERKGKLGLGTAYIAGFNWSLRNGYQYTFEMDADFSHNPEDLVRLYKSCSKPAVDLSIGSRYIKGGHVENWPLNRILMSYFASLYVRIVLWIAVRDTTSGFKCYSREVLEKINFHQIKFKGYAFQIEMKYAALKLGFKAEEVPITFKDRKVGVSKMDMSIFTEAFWGVLKMKTKRYEPNAN